jgi:hypothetical protein
MRRRIVPSSLAVTGGDPESDDGSDLKFRVYQGEFPYMAIEHKTGRSIHAP